MNHELNFFESAIQTSKRAFWYVFIFSAAVNMMMLALPIYTLQVLDRVVASGSIETLVMLTIITVILFCAYGAFTMARQMTLIKMGQWFDQKISGKLFSTSLSASAVSQNINGSQNLRDLSALKGFLTGAGIIAFFDLPWALMFIVVLLAIHPLLGILAIVGAIILCLIGFANEKAVKKALENANELNVSSMKQIEASTRNAEVIEAMGMMNNVIDSWQKKNEAVLGSQTVAQSRSAVLGAAARSIRMLLQIGAVAIGSYLFLNNAITVGAIIAGSILLGRALAPFEQSIAAWSSFANARKSYYRIKESIESAPKRAQTMELPAPEGRLSVEGALYLLPGTRTPILKGVSFAIPPGHVLGIIGPSASGKSTLAKLLVGVLPPNSGSVRLDGADVYTWNRSDFGKYIGYLPQDVELFDGTVRENIARMQADAQDADVVSAAKIAGVHDMVLRLPHGYDTEIGVNGGNLSAGQRQRVGLARAFFGQPKLLILDEPNSNLDDAGENALIMSLKNAKALKITVIIIAHRPAVLNFVDKIMLMKEGAIADYGDAKEVLTKYSAGGQARAQVQKQQVSKTA